MAYNSKSVCITVTDLWQNPWKKREKTETMGMDGNPKIELNHGLTGNQAYGRGIGFLAIPNTNPKGFVPVGGYTPSGIIFQ